MSEETPLDPSIMDEEAPEAVYAEAAPPPIVASTETTHWPEDVFPTSARSFAKLARAAGWEVRIGFNRGYVPAQAAGKWEIRDGVSVWLNGYGKRAMAAWERNPNAQFTQAKLDKGVKPGEVPSGRSWKFTNGTVILARGQSFPWMGSDQTKEWTKLQGNVLPEWYVKVRTEFFAKEAATRAKAKTKAQEEADAKEQAARER